MKKFILHTLLFLLPVLAGSLILLLLPTDKKRAYHYLTKDCEGRGSWMYRRIFESKEPIDAAFLGSSHTINGMNDTLINQIFNENLSPIQHACNMGYCRLGRDLTYILMQHLIEQKKTKLFIIEVLPDEPALSHPIFPFLAEGRDVLPPMTVFNRSYFNNVYNASVAKLMYIRQNLWKEDYIYSYGLRENSGFSTNDFLADTNALKKKKTLRYKNQYKSHQWTRSMTMQFPHAWLAAISELAMSNQCKIVFLYIPPYGSPEKKPIEWANYTRYGEVWIPPDTIFTNMKNFYDEEHLNLAGANSLSSWIAKKMMMKE